MNKLNLKCFWQKLSSVCIACPIHEFLFKTKPANFNYKFLKFVPWHAVILWHSGPAEHSHLKSSIMFCWLWWGPRTEWTSFVAHFHGHGHGHASMKMKNWLGWHPGPLQSSQESAFLYLMALESKGNASLLPCGDSYNHLHFTPAPTPNYEWFTVDRDYTVHC